MCWCMKRTVKEGDGAGQLMGNHACLMLQGYGMCAIKHVSGVACVPRMPALRSVRIREGIQ